MTDGQSWNERLVVAAREGNLSWVRECLEHDADPGYQDDEGLSPMMVAAENGYQEVVEFLLDAGAPWHAQDKEGYTAGEYASGGGQQSIVELLMQRGVAAELLLGAVARRGDTQLPGEQYLKQKVFFKDGKIVDSEGEAVMMGWEAPLMEAHAREICASGGGDILNVGFGLGIIDSAIQSHGPSSHTIIEAHPDVFEHMKSSGWGDKKGVRIVFGRWQDVIEELGPFDGIFFDTYGEYYDDMREFHQHLPRLLKSNGVYSFFNGLAPDNLFFHLTYGRLVQMELDRLGLKVQFKPMSVKELGDEQWEGVKNKYWHFSMYFLPVCTWKEGLGLEADHTKEES